jgi:hypothetical protein
MREGAVSIVPLQDIDVSVTIIESIAMSQTAIDIENNVEEDELSI